MLEPRKRRWLRFLADALTTLRLIATVVTDLVLYNNIVNGIALDLCLIFSLSGFAAITDIFDGIFARLSNIYSPFGVIFDKTVDKIFVITIMALFEIITWNLTGFFSSWALIGAALSVLLVLIIVAVDLSLGIVGAICLRRGYNVEAARIGKNKMVVESGTLLVWIAILYLEPRYSILPWAIWILNGCLAMSVGLACASARYYYVSIKHQKTKKEKRRGNENFACSWSRSKVR
ncbi:MAG: CDP-alcohol phosphatidyltransferase family protein [Candidatus Portnoybacteria bacterium]|nr:CDP-alcohol phosphatidyltransferase family protein [Candidatus Portnoybacteria bacterium]